MSDFVDKCGVFVEFSIESTRCRLWRGTLVVMDRDELTYAIRGAAFTVHRRLGPGLLESAYEKCLLYELRKSGLQVQSQVTLPFIYDEVKVDAGYRIDLLVEDQIIIELKSVDELAPIHTAQLLTYLRLANKPLGLLMNFNVSNMQNGIKRYILESARTP